MWSPNVSVSSDEAGDQLFSRRKLCLSARNAGEGWVRHVALLQISLLHKYTYNKPDHTRKVHKNGHNQLLQGFLTSEWSLGLEDDHLTKKKEKISGTCHHILFETQDLCPCEEKKMTEFFWSNKTIWELFTRIAVIWKLQLETMWLGHPFNDSL